MLRKRYLPALMLPALLALSACGGSGSNTPEGEETFKLKFASYNIPSAAEAKASKQWAEDLEKETDGRVTVDFFYQESLLSGDETLPGVADGRADMGYVATAYYPSELALSNVAGVPFVTGDIEAQGQAFGDLYESNEALQKEWEAQGVRVLTWAPVSANIVAMEKPADSLDDLKGKKVRGYGYVSEALSMAGASAVGISQTEVYEALQHGVLDGTSGTSFDVAADRDYQEVAPHFLDINYGNYAVTANVINLETWEAMPEDIQEIITESRNGYLDEYLKEVDKLEVAACDELLEAGGDVTLLDESATTDWASKAGPAIQKIWTEDVKASQPDADSDAFYNAYTSAIEEHEAGSEYESAMKRCAARQ